MAGHNVRGPCGCGAFLPPGDPEGGIHCSSCGANYSPETLELNGFEWREDRDEWVHPSELDADAEADA